MRYGWLVVLAGFWLGCTASKPAPAPAPPAPVAQADDDRVIVAALVIEPDIVASAPALEIPRDVRAPAAYAGFEDVIFTHYYLYMDDRQLNYGNGFGSGSSNFDRFERQAITQRVGVSYR